MRQLRNNALLSAACLVTLLAPCGATGAEKGEYFIEVTPGTTNTNENEYPVRIVSIPTIAFQIRYLRYQRPADRPDDAGAGPGGLAPESRTLTYGPRNRGTRTTSSPDGASFPQPQGPTGLDDGGKQEPQPFDPGVLEPAPLNASVFGRSKRTTSSPDGDSFPQPHQPTGITDGGKQQPEHFDPGVLEPAPLNASVIGRSDRTTSSPDGDSIPQPHQPTGITDGGKQQPEHFDPGVLEPAPLQSSGVARQPRSTSSPDGASFPQPQGPTGIGAAEPDKSGSPDQFSNATGDGQRGNDDDSGLDPGQPEPDEDAGDPDDGLPEDPDDGELMPVDCNGNGTPDADEIANDLGLDMDANGRIDRCEQSGDVNYDGSIDIDDLLAVILAWGACQTGDGTCYEDVNKDGIVNEDDVSVILIHWNFFN